MKERKLRCVMENLSADAVATAANMPRRLAHPMRLWIVDVLTPQVKCRYVLFRIIWKSPQAATSQHLNRMRRVGLIQSERHGKEVWYSTADRRPIALLNSICNC